jgi:hypothetical protein
MQTGRNHLFARTRFPELSQGMRIGFPVAHLMKIPGHNSLPYFLTRFPWDTFERHWSPPSYDRDLRLARRRNFPRFLRPIRPFVFACRLARVIIGMAKLLYRITLRPCITSAGDPWAIIAAVGSLHIQISV